MTNFNLWRHQQEAVRLFKQEPRLYLNWDTGTGKTLGALASCREAGASDILVIAPKSSHLAWETENEKVGLNLRVVSYEYFRMHFESVRKYDVVICDEAHRLKNPTAKVVKKARELIMPHEAKIFLSGTPADKYFELYSQLKLLKPEAIPWRNYSQFIQEFYYLNAWYKPERLKSKDAEKFLKEFFTKHLHIVKREDVLEIPDIETIDIKFKPFKYDEDFNNYTLTTFIEEYKYGQGLDATMSIVKKDKYDWVLDFIEDNPDTIVFSFFKSPIEYLKEKYKDSYIITGESKDDLEKAIKLSDKPVFATYSLKEGANLQGYSKVVFLSLPLAYRDYEQAISRVYRAGQKKKVVVYRLLQNPIDRVILNIINEKKSIHDYLRG